MCPEILGRFELAYALSLLPSPSCYEIQSSLRNPLFCHQNDPEDILALPLQGSTGLATIPKENS